MKLSKTNIKIKYIAIVAMTILMFSSCKEDTVNFSNILTSKTWKRGLNDKNPSTNPSGAVFFYPVKNCEKDDTFKFDSDGNLALNRNANQCDQSELQAEIQTYTLNRTTKELVIDGTKYTLAEESSTQIKYYKIIPQTTGIGYAIYLLQ